MPRCASCNHDNRTGARFCEACGAALGGVRAGEQRKVVTVLFSDVTSSTALGERLDPEALRGVLARYFDMARLAVERHGGSVEKFIGDAVMAVFGIPLVHEDDALRAVRAASELRDGLAALNEGLTRDYGTALELRIGVNTGEVVAGTEERLATGDAVNVAARLEQAAHPGEILVGAATRALVQGVVELEPVERLDLKGKSAPVEAYRLVSVRFEVAPRRRVGAMVGRERELERLRAALAQAVDSRCCQLFTVLGDAGVGKSRLAYEFLTGLDGATVVRGGCPPYGEGITYWPVVEVLKQVLGEEPQRRLEELGLDSFSSRAVHAVLGDPGAATSVDEIARATRVLLEAVAAEAPLVVVLDDIQWGEAAFLDLVDHVAELSRDVPMLLLCMARPELYDRRPGWGGGKLNATTVLLEPLAAGDADVLVASLLDGHAADQTLRARILAAAEGNPLFAEEMVALVRDSPGGRVTVPPTIQALLAARLDQLEPAERAVLGCGSIEGRVFHRGAVQALSPDETELTTPLSGLVRRELLRPDRAQLAGEEAFRFRHLLIRDAAYDALPKATRAELHERFAVWIGAHGAEVVEHDEVAGYHLERAYRCRAELGPPGDSARDLAARAGEHLAVAGTRAATRGDMRAATGLLSRAIDLMPSCDARRLGILPAFGRALQEAGQWERAEAVLSEALELAQAAGDRRVAADAAVARMHLRLFTGSTASHGEARLVLADAARVFEEVGDEAGLARALGLGGQIRFWAGESAAAIDDLERAARHARTAGDRVQEVESLHYVLLACVNGPMPLGSALARVLAMRDQLEGDRRLEVTLLRCQSRLEAMRGGFDGARVLIARATALMQELGLEIVAGGVQLEAAEIELLAGDLPAAERALRPAVERLQRIGDKGHLATVAPVLADVLCAQGRGAEAVALIEIAARWVIEDDLDPQIGWRRVQAKLLGQRGDFAEAERLGREATRIAERTDFLDHHARAHEDLAEVLRRAGQHEAASDELDSAIRLHEQKGNVVSATRVRTLRDAAARAVSAGSAAPPGA